jgi:hypothetical protein
MLWLLMEFEFDPRDYYPGVNAITLLIEKGDDESIKQAQQLVPLVSFAVARRGGVSSSDYWDLATVLELACIGNDWNAAISVLPKVMDKAQESWMPETTLGNLNMLKQTIAYQGQDSPELNKIIEQFNLRMSELK